MSNPVLGIVALSKEIKPIVTRVRKVLFKILKFGERFFRRFSSKL